MARSDIPPTQPLRISVNGEPYRLMVFIIHTKDARDHRTPALCKMLKDGDAIDLAGGEEFMTAYVPENMIHGS